MDKYPVIDYFNTIWDCFYIRWVFNNYTEKLILLNYSPV